MPDFVRVEHKPTGNKFTTTRAVLDADSDLDELEEEAVDMSGQPLLPTYPKPRVPLGTKANAKTPKE